MSIPVDITDDLATIDFSPGDICASLGASGNVWKVQKVFSAPERPGETMLVMQGIKGRDIDKTQNIYSWEIIKAVKSERAVYLGQRRRGI
jgi:hypothetical protein